MKVEEKFWQDLDCIIKKHDEYILSDDQHNIIAKEEQKAYESNISDIEEIIKSFQEELNSRGFWTELQISPQGFRFRFSKRGYYGPGGFSSQYHVSGPLVLGTINPAGNPLTSFYNNNLEENTQIGCNYDREQFIAFVKTTMLDYISPNNLILSKEQYDYLRNFKGDS